MRAPYNWLKEYIKTDLSPKEMADKLTLIGHALDKPIEYISDPGSDKKNPGSSAVMDFEDRGNRADVLGLVGLARDLAAVSGRQLKEPTLSKLPEVANQKFATQIKIETEKVIRFLAVTFSDVKIKPSNAEIAQKIRAYGLEPINNVVDLTNYVMVELGFPLHAFDRDRVSKLILRKACPGESLTTFEGTKLKLTEEDLVAADERGPLTLTTAIGGRASGVSAKTKNLLVEAGLYHQPTARRSALRHKIKNETASRLGRYYHPDCCQVAIGRFIYLMKNLYGYEPSPASFDYYPERFQKEYAPKIIDLSSERLNLLAGEEIGFDQATKILEKLGIIPKIGINPSKGVIPFEVPYFRTDVIMEDDLIEEVLRIHGFDKITSFLPARSAPVRLDFPERNLEEKARDLLVKLGYNEVISQQIIDLEENEKTGWPEPERIIHLKNPINSDLNILRPQLLSGPLKYAQSYQKHLLSPIKIFEIGKTYAQDRSKSGYEKYQEARKLSLTRTGEYLDLKADVETLLNELQVAKYEFRRLDFLFKKNRAASIWVGEEGIGKMGEVKSSVLAAFAVDGPITHAVFYINRLIRCVDQSFAKRISTGIINYISEDFTFALAADDEVGPFITALKSELNASTEVVFKGIYQDEKMKKEGRKSLTINARFSASQAGNAKKDSATLQSLAIKS